MFSITLTLELLQIKSMQKENIDNVEYVFLLTVRKLSPSPICSCHSLLNTFPAVTWLGKVCWTAEIGLGIHSFTVPVTSNTSALAHCKSITSLVYVRNDLNL